MEVSTPSSAIPRTVAQVPSAAVPISTAAFARSTAARKRSTCRGDGAVSSPGTFAGDRSSRRAGPAPTEVSGLTRGRLLHRSRARDGVAHIVRAWLFSRRDPIAAEVL
ncbi:hypothetical protein GCM10027174_01450 [Salinifilum aidingensis]